MSDAECGVPSPVYYRTQSSEATPDQSVCWQLPCPAPALGDSLLLACGGMAGEERDSALRVDMGKAVFRLAGGHHGFEGEGDFRKKKRE